MIGSDFDHYTSRHDMIVKVDGSDLRPSLAELIRGEVMMTMIIMMMMRLKMWMKMW